MDGVSHIIWAVNANWNAENGWNVEANSVENPNRWNDGNQVLSKLSLFQYRPILDGIVLASHRAFCRSHINL